MLNWYVGEARKSETSRVDIALTASQGTVENQQPSTKRATQSTA